MNAQEQFAARLVSVNQKLAEIDDRVGYIGCQKPNTITWPIVGDLGRLEADLENILEYLRPAGERG